MNCDSISLVNICHGILKLAIPILFYVTVYGSLSRSTLSQANTLKFSTCVAMESREYHSMQTLLVEVWQYKEEWDIKPL